MDNDTRITRHLQIYGRVQGVGFRYATQRKARGLGITGWVRNRPDGSVEAVVQGGTNAVTAMIAWTRLGPTGANVSEVRIAEGDGVYTEFMTLPTE